MLKRCNYKEYDQMPEPKPCAIHVARWAPRWFRKKYPDVINVSDLAPSKHLLKQAKQGLLWSDYSLLFYQEIYSNPNYKADLVWIWDISIKEDVYLLCWEKTESNPWDTLCHTNLLIILATLHCGDYDKDWIPFREKLWYTKSFEGWTFYHSCQ